MKRIISLVLLLSLFLCLFSCQNQNSPPNEDKETLEGIEAIICKNHGVFSPLASPYAHRYVYNLDEFYSHLGELGKKCPAIKIDYSGDEALVFYQIEATNVNDDAAGIINFLTEESEAYVSTFLILKNYHCEDGVSFSSSFNSSCNLRFHNMSQCFTEIRHADKYDYFVDWAGAEDFAIIRIWAVYNTKITDPSLLTFELDIDAASFKNYDVYYGNDLAFQIDSCVPLDDELISFIKNNLVYID